eukprot:gene10893-3597_t
MTSTQKMPQTIKEKIEISLDLKKQGNEFLKQGEYKRACHLYNKIFLYINGLNTNVTDVLSGGQNGNSKKVKSPQDIEIQELRVSVHMNLSLCYLKLNNYQKSLDNVQKALHINPDNVKGIFRRGQSYLGLNDLDRAKVDLLKARETYPNDSQIKKEIERLNLKFKQSEQKEKNMMKKMFEKMSQE